MRCVWHLGNFQNADHFGFLSPWGYDDSGGSEIQLLSWDLVIEENPLQISHRPHWKLRSMPLTPQLLQVVMSLDSVSTAGIHGILVLIFTYLVWFYI